MGQKYIYERNDFECNVVDEVGDFLHLHNEIELLYIYKGKMKVVCNFQEYTVGENEFVIIFPNTLHSVKKLEKVEYLLSIFSKDVFPSMSSIWACKSVVGPPIIHLQDLHEEVGFSLKQIYNRKDIQVKCNITIAYLTIILDNILNAIELKPFYSDKNMEWLYRVIKYLNENYHHTIRLEEISRELGISKYHLSRNFNERIGCSISEYVNQLRVGQAKNMLKNTDLQIIDIAMECGFESLSTFFRVFKSLNIGTPNQYRGRRSNKKHVD